MPAYIVAQISITDAKQYAEYTRLTPAAIEKYGGHFIVRGGRSTVLEGPADTRRIVVIEFTTFEQAESFYHSKEYQQARKLRENAAAASFLLVEGWTDRPS